MPEDVSVVAVILHLGAEECLPLPPQEVQQVTEAAELSDHQGRTCGPTTSLEPPC